VPVTCLFKLAENWAVPIRADYGSGDSGGLFLAQAALRWAVGRERRQGIFFGYRYDDAKLEENSREGSTNTRNLSSASIFGSDGRTSAYAYRFGLAARQAFCSDHPRMI